MTISVEFIDQIVQNVMREMQTRVSPVDPAPKVTKQIVEPGAIQATTLPVPGLVISEDVLIRSNAAGRTISLQSGAIITPSGRDYVRKNAIRISTQIGGSKAVTGTGTLIAIGSNTNSKSAASAAGWQTLAASTEQEAASLASGQLLNGLVACFGGEPSVVACLLNRNSSVRAAVVTRSTNLAALTSLLNPQVVCLESAGWSFSELLRLLKGLVLLPAAPKGWAELNAGGVR